MRRFIRHKNEETHWAALGREIGPRSMAMTIYAAHWVSLAGELRGLDVIRPSGRINLTPFLVGSLTETPAAIDDDREDDTEAGLDAKVTVAKSLTADLTYNTDFAQVEVDQQQVNLTRFSLFFPEKRDFFLENSGIFDFGPPNRGRDEREINLLDVFFSRRIGLEQGLEVPIEWGGRLTGRLGGFNLGLLNVVTEAVDENGFVVPDTRFSVARLKRNVGRRSSIGAIFTDRDEEGPRDNQVAGLDASWKPTQSTDFFLFGAQSDSPAADGDQGSWGGGFLYTGRDLRASADVVEAQEDFDPGVGFLQRRNFVRYNPRVRYTPRINRWGTRGLFFDARARLLRALVDRSAREPAGSALAHRRAPQQRVPVAPRPHRRHRAALRPVRDPSRRGDSARPLPLRLLGARRPHQPGQAGLRPRPDRQGRLLRRRAVVREPHQPVAHCRASSAPRPPGRGTTSSCRRATSRPASTARCSTSRSRPRSASTRLMQYNDAAELVGLNMRFNWEYRPGADLFVVYNENWAAPTFSARETTRRQLIVKLTYLWQG